MKYPKMQTLWMREEKGKRNVIEGKYSREEFSNIKNWLVTEKIDGMNIRVCYRKGTQLSFLGRTDEAMIPPRLLKYLHEIFTLDLIKLYFAEAEEVILFGEGYGAKIQKGGGSYSKEQEFCLFDIYLKDGDGICWWLDYQKIIEISMWYGIRYPTILSVMEVDEIVDYVRNKPNSVFAENDRITEGVVARALPMVLFRNGTPVKFKLKCKDFI